MKFRHQQLTWLHLKHHSYLFRSPPSSELQAQTRAFSGTVASVFAQNAPGGSCSQALPLHSPNPLRTGLLLVSGAGRGAETSSLARVIEQDGRG